MCKTAFILSSFCVDMTILKYVLCCRSLVDQLLNINSILFFLFLLGMRYERCVTLETLQSRASCER